MVDKGNFNGLFIYNNCIFLVLFVAFNSVISEYVFTVLLYVLIVTLAALNVSPIKTPKLSGGIWYYVIVSYTLLASLFYGWVLLK